MTSSASGSATARAEPVRGPARQRGAIGLFGILTLLLAVVFTALAVDAGRLWYERRQLQAVADLAALEAARGLGCGRVAGDVLAAAQAAALRNGYGGNLGSPPNVVEVGGLSTVAGLRRFNAGADSDAVHVLATETVPASLVLGGGLFGRSITLQAEATARAEPAHATFSAGSYLLRVDTTSEDASLLNGLLGGLLGSSLSLDAVSYKGLASTDVNLAQLVRASGTVGSVEELLNTSMSVADIVGLTASAVSQQGAVDASVTAGLQEILAASANQAAVRLGDVLDVSVPASDAAGRVDINVLDLIATTIMVANKQHAVAIALPVNVGSLLNVNALVNVIEPPRIAVGPPGRDPAGEWCAQARTAQVDVSATVQANLVGLARLDLKLAAQLAQGEAHLESLDVVPGATRAVVGATPGIASLGLSNVAGSGPATVKVLGITVATIGLDLPVQTAGPRELIYNVGHPVAEHLPAKQSVAAPVGESLANVLSDPDALDVRVLGLGVPAGLTGLIGQLLGGIGSLLLDPLLKLLGIQLGGLDVTVEDIEYTGGARLVI